MTDRIRILLADDHRVVREGLRTFLELTGDIEVAGEAADGREALQLCTDLVPDVVLMDLVMPGLNGIEATRQIRAQSPTTKVIALTSFTEDDTLFPAIKAGAAGYLLKDVEPHDLAEAVRTVHRGEGLLDPRVAAKVMHELAAGTPAHSTTELTAREHEVLGLLAGGRSNKEIASELGVSVKTVKTHVSNVLQKLHLADRTQAALYAAREGVVREERPGS